jgi:hypothetical protein
MVLVLLFLYVRLEGLTRRSGDWCSGDTAVDAKGITVGVAHVELWLAVGGRWLRDRVGRVVAVVLLRPVRRDALHAGNSGK